MVFGREEPTSSCSDFLFKLSDMFCNRKMHIHFKRSIRIGDTNCSYAYVDYHVENKKALHGSIILSSLLLWYSILLQLSRFI